MMTHESRTALVTGASGYVGGRLVPRLLDQGWRVRVLTRSRSSIDGNAWADDVEVVEGDAGDEAVLGRALDGVDVAYYLIHSMSSTADFAERDRELAQSFNDAAETAGVARIVYLGGLHPADEELSPHLASRVEVGRVFLDGGVPAAVLQAAIVLGAGSISFQMLRYLTDRLPVMLAPRWLHNRIQPIAVEDLLHHLVGAADLPPDLNRSFDVGGPEVLTYAEMIQRFADVTGLNRRIVLGVPVLTPGLASRWIGLVTPLDTKVARPLVDSLIHEVVCRDDSARYLPPPAGGGTGFDEAIAQAVAGIEPDRGLRNLAIATSATVACAVVGSWATDPDSRWYRRLSRPSWQPPAAVFPIVWTALYADVAITSAAAVTRLEHAGEHEAARSHWRAFASNLALNAGWSIVFWRVRRPDLAAVEAAALTFSSVDLARRAGVGSRPRALALVPYAMWCGFATVLSGAIARRNRFSPRSPRTVRGRPARRRS